MKNYIAPLAYGAVFLREKIICGFLLAAAILAGESHAIAGIPGALAAGPQFMPHYTEEKLDEREASQIISGSPYPGVIDCLLQRPAPDGGEADGKTDVHIRYPSFGNKTVDEDIRGWVSDMADAFVSHANPISGNQGLANPDAIIDSFLNGDSEPEDGRDASFELWGAYRISRPSGAAVSIAFELWNYTGNPEGNLDIITLNYSLLTGQRLALVDIFEKPEVALKLMSSWARKELESRPGASLRSKMLLEGTEPLVENFSSITLTPEGICINFQPWQVAPQAAGIQTVSMPLKELMPSAPLLALWGKGENPDEQFD